MCRYTNLQTILQPADITVSGDRGNDTLRIDFADSVVISVRKVKIPLFIEGHTVGAFQLRLGCRAAIAEIPKLSVPAKVVTFWSRSIYLILLLTESEINISPLLLTAIPLG